MQNKQNNNNDKKYHIDITSETTIFCEQKQKQNRSLDHHGQKTKSFSG